MRRIVFVLDAIQDTHALKRVEEFVDNGFLVKVYGFNRQNCPIPTNPKYDICVLGEFPSGENYLSRLPVLYKGLRRVRRECSRQDLYYYFGLNAALVGSLAIRSEYIYEECDLTHAYFNRRIIFEVFERIDKRLIRKSKLTVLTSEGFRELHFGAVRPETIEIVPNRLNPACLDQYPPLVKTKSERLRIGFVGVIRSRQIYNFAKVFASLSPNHEFHFWGVFSPSYSQQEIDGLLALRNVFYHGRFRNPDDLATIYSQIDLTMATYDTTQINPQYAEPNKLYEAIFYETPIIVSHNSFLADKVERLGVGFSVDALDDGDIRRLTASISGDVLCEKTAACHAVPKKESININTKFITRCRILCNE